VALILPVFYAPNLATGTNPRTSVPVVAQLKYALTEGRAMMPAAEGGNGYVALAMRQTPVV